MKKWVINLMLVIAICSFAMPVQASPVSVTRTELTVSQAAKTGWKTAAGKKYYYQNGVQKTGKVRVGKNWYYFGPEMKTGLFTDEHGTVYYAARNGVLQKGFRTIAGKRYYFNANTASVRFEGHEGLLNVNGKIYFCIGGAIQTGLIRDEGRLYYAARNGLLRTGWQTVGGKRYYFWNTNSNGHRKYEGASGTCQINGKTYRFDESGALITGLNAASDGISFSDGHGIMQTGWQTVDGKRYYFSPGTYAALTGPQTVDGRQYVFDSDGVLVKEEETLKEENEPNEEPSADGGGIYISDVLVQAVRNSGKNRIVTGVNTCKGILTYYGYDQHAQKDRPLDCSGCGMCSFLTVISTFKQGSALDAPAYRKSQMKKLLGTTKCPISIYAGKKMVESAGMTAKWVTVIKSNDEVVADITAHLRKGMPVVVSLRHCDRRGKTTKRYSNQNHYALLVGVTRDGKRAFLMDSGRKGCRYVDLEDICWHIPSANADAESKKKILWSGWGSSGGYMKIFP